MPWPGLVYVLHLWHCWSLRVCAEFATWSKEQAGNCRAIYRRMGQRQDPKLAGEQHVWKAHVDEAEFDKNFLDFRHLDVYTIVMDLL